MCLKFELFEHTCSWFYSMGLVQFGDETRSVISDTGNIYNVDFANDASLFEYNGWKYEEVVISSPFPLVEGKPQFVTMGKTICTPITIENPTTDAVTLWSVEIYDSKPKYSFTLSVMEPPSPDSDEEYIKSFVESFSMEDRTLLPCKTLTIWLSCKTMVKGLQTTAVPFSFDDYKIERMGFIMAEDKISESLSTSYNRSMRVIPRTVSPMQSQSRPHNANELLEYPIKDLTLNNYVLFF
ncbi:hypothetical protein HanPI659440_Chr00c11g0724111 [Helianthus annuus]|nr:hypothetical protein HanOQP8_Chr04g0129291 [Helianthus annuus]KAJ0816744.1 hypothetical protein HanPI659440_Chr00c11g0724111 [Helianthus annuus]